MAQRKVGQFSVFPIGLGCMNLSHAYGAPLSPQQGEAVLLEALAMGVTLFDTAALYGFGANEELLGRALARHRHRFVLSSKCGFSIEGKKRAIDGRPQAIKRSVEESLARLKTDVIDVCYLHRWDKKVPIEDCVGALSDLVREGKIKSIGLSEVSATILRKAHAVHPIAAVQSEYSLWTRNPEIAVLDACRELGAAFVAFSPLGRGFLTGKLRDLSELKDGDIRRNMPRFAPKNYAVNLRLLDGCTQIAEEAGCTLAQLSLAWLLARGEHVIPIPGTTSLVHLAENLGATGVILDASAIARLDALINQQTVTGHRYSAKTQSEIDTEEFSVTPEIGD